MLLSTRGWPLLYFLTQNRPIMAVLSLAGITRPGSMSVISAVIQRREVKGEE
ncbi:MAG: hypothetical protein ACI8X3_002412 [Saprospiraceae bacterium]|jgi:hypothetical protein